MRRVFIIAACIMSLLAVVLVGPAAQAVPLLNAGFWSFTYRDTQLPTPFAQGEIGYQIIEA